MACHTLPLQKAEVQGEMQLATQPGSHPSLNSTFFG